ncbi:MAG: flippase-like domain-containing protein [Chloroflexi bacterium]|nr:MAG: flippase-like domain-containing protein [Chloroflexota bacterium]
MGYLTRSVWARTLLGLVIAAALLAVVLLRTDLGATFDALGEANFAYLPPAMLVFAFAVWFQALRWRYLLKPLADVPAHRLYPVVFVGHLANSLVPLRAGEVLRALVVNRREGVGRMAALGTLVVERALDGLALSAMLLIFVAVVDSSSRLWELVLAGTVLFGLATALLIVIALHPDRSLSLGSRLIDRGPVRFRSRLRRWLRSFLTGTRALRTPGGIVAALATTAAFWVSVAVVYAIVGEAFALKEGFGTYLLVTAAANLSVSIPSSQGGLGPFEFFVRETLVFSGVASPVATAYALVLHATILVTMIVIGAFCLRTAGLSLDMLREASSVEEDEEKEAL